MKPVEYSKLNYIQKRMVKNLYIIDQNNKCMYCGVDLNSEPPERILNLNIDWSYFPPNFRKYPIHLQHNHETDMTEGVVHMYCNAVMWQYENR